MNNTIDNAAESVSSPVQSLEGKYLTFILGNEEYGIDIVKVKEIIKVMDITHVPKMPSYIKGVINLRGEVIPIVELRIKFGMEAIGYTKHTCIIVVETGTLTMGVVVDTVSEVMDMKGEEIDPPPGFGGKVETGFILGMGKIKGSVKVLLDIEKVLSKEGVRIIGDLHKDEQI